MPGRGLGDADCRQGRAQLADQVGVVMGLGQQQDTLQIGQHGPGGGRNIDSVKRTVPYCLLQGCPEIVFEAGKYGCELASDRLVYRAQLRCQVTERSAREMRRGLKHLLLEPIDQFDELTESGHRR